MPGFTMPKRRGGDKEKFSAIAPSVVCAQRSRSFKLMTAIPLAKKIN
jgi:hypothetical protein